MMKNIFIKIAEAVVPIEKFIAKFRKPDCLIDHTHVEAAKNVLMDGDFLFERNDYMLSNLFIPGQWKHIAVYIKGFVFEASSEGVRKMPLEQWLYRKDHVGIGRQSIFYFTEENLQNGINFLADQLGEPYEYDYTKDTKKAWYCSLYCYNFLLACNPSVQEEFPIPLVWGNKVITPQDIFMEVKQVVKFN